MTRAGGGSPAETLIVDGYNIAHSWAEPSAALARGALEEARRILVARLAAYAAVRPVRVEVVFDGPRRAGPDVSPPEVVDGVTVRFSAGSGSADAMIERLVYQATRQPGGHRVRVATGDRLHRDLVRAMGAETTNAAELDREVGDALAEISDRARRLTQAPGRYRRLEGELPPDVYRQLEALRRALPPQDGE